MNAYALWIRGPRGPSLVLLQNRGSNAWMSADEKERKLCEPILIPPERHNLSLNELAELYPAPVADASKVQ
jgi:hypothetical protein